MSGSSSDPPDLREATDFTSFFICAPHLKILAKKERIYFSTKEKRGRHRDRDRNRSRYRKPFIIGLLGIDAGSAMMPKSIRIAIAIAIPIPIVPQEWSLSPVAAIGRAVELYVAFVCKQD